MLTPRQVEILSLIIKYYGLEEEPIGSKTLLNRSDLKVSPATVRNDMLALEQVGYLRKAHSSSGRIPSNDGYRFYVNQLINLNDDRVSIEDNPFKEIVKGAPYDPLQVAILAADLLSSLTGYTVVVLGQDQDIYHFEEFKLIPLDSKRIMAILMTDGGRVENEIFEMPYPFSKEDIKKIVTMINQELIGLNLEDVYQRMKLSIPMMLQRLIGYSLNFTPLVDKMRTQLKGHNYYVSGKHYIYDLIDPLMSSESIRELMSLVDGSNKVYQILENRDPGISVLFGFEYAPQFLAHINLISANYLVDKQKICLGLIGPSTMPYYRIISLFEQMIEQLINY